MSVNKTIQRPEDTERRIRQTAGGQHPDVLQGLKEVQGKTIKPNVLTPKIKENTRRVILLHPNTGSLSWPIVYSSMLAQVLPQNFPNADFVDYSCLMQLVRRPAGCNLTTPETSFSKSCEKGAFDEGRKNSVTFYLEESAKPLTELLPKASELTMHLPRFGIGQIGAANLITPEGIRLIGGLAATQSERLQDIMDVQALTLAALGLEGLPRQGEILTLKPKEYSRELKETLEQVRRDILPHARGKPVILVNPFKREESHFPSTDVLNQKLRQMVQQVDAAFIINKPPDNDRENRGIRERVHQLQRRLMRTADRKSLIIDTPPHNLLQFAATMLLAQETGGFYLDVFGGGTLLADWLNARTLNIELAAWSDYNRNRVKKTKLSPSRYPDEILPAAKRLLDQ